MDVLLAREVSDRLRISLRQAYRLFACGQLKGYRAGACVRFYAQSVEDYRLRNENTVPAVSSPPPISAHEHPRRGPVKRRSPKVPDLVVLQH